MQFPLEQASGGRLTCQSFISASLFVFFAEKTRHKKEVANED
jgi:hypothetical protein